MFRTRFKCLGKVDECFEKIATFANFSKHSSPFPKHLNLVRNIRQTWPSSHLNVENILDSNKFKYLKHFKLFKLLNVAKAIFDECFEQDLNV